MGYAKCFVLKTLLGSSYKLSFSRWYTGHSGGPSDSGVGGRVAGTVAEIPPPTGSRSASAPVCRSPGHTPPTET